MEQAIHNAHLIGKILTTDLEVIALHGGNSRDHTYDEILHMKKIYPDLKIINRVSNHEG